MKLFRVVVGCLLCGLLVSQSVFAANPLNTYLSPNSTTDDMTMYLCGMDTGTKPDGDTIWFRGGYKIGVWSPAVSEVGGANEAALAKTNDSTGKLILYCSTDLGFYSPLRAIDTTDAGNEWNASDEFSHAQIYAQSKGKSIVESYYVWAELTRIRNAVSGDTIEFLASSSFPPTNADSMSIFPNPYMVFSCDTIRAKFFRAHCTPTAGFNYGMRAYPDYSHWFARSIDSAYSARAFARNYANLGGTNNDVYGWRALSDSGFCWDGIYEDNNEPSSNTNTQPRTGPLREGWVVILGGNIYSPGRNAIIGNANGDSTTIKIMRDFQQKDRQKRDWLNNGANFWDGKAKILAGNIGSGSPVYLEAGFDPDTLMFGAGAGMNLLLLEFAGMPTAYSSRLPAAENSGTGFFRRTASLRKLATLCEANDLYVQFSCILDNKDKTTASGYGQQRYTLGRGPFVRAKVFMGKRGIVATAPPFWSVIGGQAGLPCNTGYGGLSASPYCDDRNEVDTFLINQPLFCHTFELGSPMAAVDSVSYVDSSGQSACWIHHREYRYVSGSDTTYSTLYHFPRKFTSWGYSRNDIHMVRITPPDANYRFLEIDGTTTVINGASQACWTGEDLILTKTVMGSSVIGSKKRVKLSGVNVR